MAGIIESSENRLSIEKSIREAARLLETKTLICNLMFSAVDI